MKKFIILSLLLLFNSSLSLAHTDVDYTNLGKTIRYVRDGATGANNGTSWADAYEDTDDFTPTRDYVYFFADGTYLSETLSVAESGSTYIYYVKATADDHGSDTGWDSAYGDGVAEFQGAWTAQRNYYIFDGQVGGGPSAWRTGHGFYFTPTGCTSSSSTYIIYAWNVSYSPSYYEFHHINMELCGEDTLAEGGGTGEQSVNKLWDIHYFTYDHCWMHDADTTIFQIYNTTDNLTVEYSVIEKRNTVSTVHGENIMWASTSGPATFRYNIIQDSAGSGMLYMDNAAGQGPLYAYGNIFYQSSTRYFTSNGMLGMSSAGNDINGLYVYNNTFINGYDGGGGTTQPCFSANAVAGTQNVVIRNNICWNTGGRGLYVDTSTHNLYDDSGQAAADDSDGQYYSGAIGDLLTDYSNYDFTLKIATDDGYDLSSPYNADPIGTTRGADSVWDRGAFEYDEGGDSGAGLLTVKNFRFLEN